MGGGVGGCGRHGTDRRLSIAGADFTIQPTPRWNERTAEARGGGPRAVVESPVIIVLRRDKHPDEAALYFVIRLLERLGPDCLWICRSVNRGVQCSGILLQDLGWRQDLFDHLPTTGESTAASSMSSL